MILVEIKGIKDRIEFLSRLNDKISNPVQPLNKSGSYMQQEALRNFTEEGAVMQVGGWEPLKQVTLDIKEDEGYGDQPIMVREGNLRDSFYKSDPKVSQRESSISVYNPVKYAKFHQTGYGVPQRVLLRLREGHISKITNIFLDWIKRSISSSFTK